MMSKVFIWVEETFIDTKKLIVELKNLISSRNKDLQVKLLIPCRWWEIIWSLVKNSLGLKESDIFRVKFSNLKYENGEEKVIIKDSFDRDIYTKLINLHLNDKDVVVIFVDDLVDSWLTVENIRDEFKSERFLSAVLYSKEGKNEDKVDLCVRQIEDKWIVFPWE